MPDLTPHTPTIGGSAYSGCAPMWVVIQHVADGRVMPRASALVADHDVTLRLQGAGYTFPHFHARITPEGHVEEIVTPSPEAMRAAENLQWEEHDRLVSNQLHAWARTTL